jgi:GNAT superfamily N-acetyltransferase
LLSFRPVDPESDRAFILELHCLSNYASYPAWSRNKPFREHLQHWLGTEQPAVFYRRLIESLDDPRTIAEIWEEAGRAAAFLWVSFEDLPDYDIVAAELNDIVVIPEKQRIGIGRVMMHHAESLAREHGATILRSDTGADNTARRALLENNGFESYRIRYEKHL